MKVVWAGRICMDPAGLLFEEETHFVWMSENRNVWSVILHECSDVSERHASGFVQEFGIQKFFQKNRKNLKKGVDILGIGWYYAQARLRAPNLENDTE